ncbi:hypothetical protein PHYBOEH_001262 [Phytophthora boehmeriae]|uniref:Uncharacterized protein n=1 Tax=Phytophthora boehmeriae TaxID=109152 RepID=A0A8T1WVH4_9STRA|nr:hypothetical protein PHYBOEH_001262 [Phytophthora boehmeriae]
MEDYDELTTAELMDSVASDFDGAQTDRSIVDFDTETPRQDDEQLLRQLSELQPPNPPRSVRFTSEQSEDSPRLQNAQEAAPRSPLLKKFAPIKDRRVNTVLLEALHLADISRDEIGVIERSVKRLHDAILGFSMLVDKQVKIVGAANAEDRERIKADIQDLSYQLKASNILIENSCDRMKKHLQAGRNQICAHKRRLTTGPTDTNSSDGDVSECSTPRCSVNDQPQYQHQPQQLQERQQPQYRSHSTEQTGIRFNRSPSRPSLTPGTGPVPYGCRSLATKSYLSPVKSNSHSPGKKSSLPVASRSPQITKVPLVSLLDPRIILDEKGYPIGMVSPDLFASVLDAVDLQEKEFLDTKELKTALQGLLAFFIARSPVLRFVDKAYHRRLLPQYVDELANLAIVDMQLIPQLSGRSSVVIPTNTLEEYVCTEPFRFDRLLFTVYVIPNDNSTKDPSLDGTLTEAKLTPSKQKDPETLETAEQTLGMAKLLHDLATAECEARNGNRISIRAQVPHSKEFSRAYIASAKELMFQETTFF